MPQAEALDELLKKKHIKLDAVVELRVNESALLQRVETRVAEMRARGEEVRIDDTPEVLSKRLASYRSLTEPLIHYYSERRKLLTVDGMMTIEARHPRDQPNPGGDRRRWKPRPPRRRCRQADASGQNGGQKGRQEGLPKAAKAARSAKGRQGAAKKAAKAVREGRENGLKEAKKAARKAAGRFQGPRRRARPGKPPKRSRKSELNARDG